MWNCCPQPLRCPSKSCSNVTLSVIEQEKENTCFQSQSQMGGCCIAAHFAKEGTMRNGIITLLLGELYPNPSVSLQENTSYKQDFKSCNAWEQH